MIETEIPPPGYERLASDEPWDPDRHVEIVSPERVTLLSEWGDEAAGPTALSPVAITSAFRFLSPEAIEILQAICGELEESASGDERIAKRVRGSIYRSEFLRGMYHEPRIIEFLRGLARAPIRAHPVSHHAIHINYAPDDLSKNVDQWHRDVISFDYVLLVTDPSGMKGGRFEYFLGPVEEGRALLEADGLPPERVASPTFPGPGWAVLQQGHRVLHRAGRLEERHERVTIVGSYWTPVPDRDDPTDLSTLLRVDPRDVALVEWSRYQALVAAHRLEHFAEELTDFRHDPGELQARLRSIAASVTDAADAFETSEEGRLISFGSGS